MNTYECNICFDSPPLPGRYDAEIGTFDAAGTQICANIKVSFEVAMVM